MSQLSEKRDLTEKFSHNPLFNVSCELRFDTILSIKDKVANFRIRKKDTATLVSIKEASPFYSISFKKSTKLY